MKNKILIVLTAVVLIGCSTPEDGYRAAIQADYQAGRITASEYHNLMMQADASERARMEAVANSLQSMGSGYNERAMYNSLPPGSQKRVRKYMQDPPKEYEIKDQYGRSVGTLEEK